MFRGELQTSPLSLFSSTSSRPLALFASRCDDSLPEDSAIVLVHDASDRIRDEAPTLSDNVDGGGGDDVDDGGDGIARQSGQPQSAEWHMRGTSLQDGNPSNRRRSQDEVSDQSRKESETEEDNDDKTSKPHAALLDEDVLHLQSPAIASTYIQSGRFSKERSSEELGVVLGIVHVQVRLLGDSRPFMLEVGVRDGLGQPARLRWSTFQRLPRLYRSTGERGVLLHMPFAKAPDVRQNLSVLTPWTTIAAPVAQACQYISSPPAALLRASNEYLTEHHDSSQQSYASFGAFASISYVRVHANCRLRRIWLSDHRQPAQHRHEHQLPPDFQLYSATSRTPE